MAFENANVRRDPGAEGAGTLTVCDADANTPAATVAADAYWDTAAALTDGGDVRRHDSVLDFIEQQQAGAGATGSGVPMLIVTANGTQATKPYRARIAFVGGERRVRVT